MSRQYKLEGTGKSPNAADKELKKSRKDLTSKLKKAKTSQALNVVSAEYSGSFSREASEHGMKSFSVTSGDGWKDLYSKAAAHADIRQFDASYAVVQFVELTSEQNDALTAKPTTAYSPRARKGCRELLSFRD